MVIIDNSPADLPPAGMAGAEIQTTVLTEIKAATDEAQSVSSDRQKRWDRYRGKSLGNEIDGRSKYVSRDVMDSIESMMPYLMRTFATGDPKIELTINGVPTEITDALMGKINDDLGTAEPNLYKLVYTAAKDALVSDTGYIGVTWDTDIETSKLDADGLTPEQYAELLTKDEIEIVNHGTAVNSQSGLRYMGVKAKVSKIIKDEIAPYNIPTWSMLYDPTATDMDDEKPKGMQTKVTIDYLKRIDRTMGGDYFDGLDELATADVTDTSEEINYFNDDSTTRFNTAGNAKKGPGREVTLIEWYTHIDVDDDGYLEPVRCWLANDKLIRWEINEDGGNPFVSLKPIIDPYKFNGTSVAELLVDIQNLNTMLTRRILDSFDYANSGRWVVDPNAGVDRRALRFNSPGSVITGKVDGIKNLSPAPFNPASLSILEFVKGLKEERSGINGTTQGIASPGLSNSAKETVAALQSAAMQRLELIARTMLETGMAAFYKKVAEQYQRNLRKPFDTKINGQEVQIPVEAIQGKVSARVIMGASATVGAQEANSIERIASFIGGLNQEMPGLLQPKDVHALASRYIRSMGFRNPEAFISTLTQFEQSVKQTQAQASQAEQEQTAKAAQQEHTVNSLAAKELEIQQTKNTADAQIKVQSNQLKEQDSVRDFILQYLKEAGLAKQQKISNGMELLRSLNIPVTG